MNFYWLDSVMIALLLNRVILLIDNNFGTEGLILNTLKVNWNLLNLCRSVQYHPERVGLLISTISGHGWRSCMKMKPRGRKKKKEQHLLIKLRRFRSFQSTVATAMMVSSTWTHRHRSITMEFILLVETGFARTPGLHLNLVLTRMDIITNLIMINRWLVK